MKKLIASLLGLGVAACQHQASPTHTAATPVPKAVATTSVMPAAPVAPALTPGMLALLRQHDFSPLLQTVHRGDSTLSSHALNGFFGPEHRRIEMVLTHVWRDPAQPMLYHLEGQDRYKGVITPFAGTFTVRQVAEQRRYSAADIANARKEGGEVENTPDMYSTVGDFILREDAARRGAGVFQGQLAIDWKQQSNGELAAVSRFDKTASQGGDITYTGTWTNNVNHRRYPFVWADNLFAYNTVHSVLADFEIGEREVIINPKYARLGWNEYYENNEWWTDAPAPSINL